MLDWSRTQIFRVLKVPAQPTPPMGAPGSVRIFRASPNYYKVLCIGWGFAQIGAVMGIMFSLWFLQSVDEAISNPRIATPQTVQPVIAPSTVEDNNTESAPKTGKKTRKGKRRAEQKIAAILSGWPSWTILLIHWAEYAAIAGFLIQIPITLAAVRLEYEQHWYIVTDRSLRIRTGLFSIQEATMSFANLQQVEVKQGPLQRLLGLSDVRVQSAGGGGGESHSKGNSDDSMHTGIFHGVNNPDEIRDLILLRLRQFRAAGLGDPDDEAAQGKPEDGEATLAAARQLLDEARKLRQSLNT